MKPRRLHEARTVVAIAILSLAALASVAGAETGSAGAVDVRSLEAFIEAERERAGVLGVSAAIVHGGEIAWLGAFGVGDQRTGRPVTLGTVFEAASIGKVVAAYGALLLVDDGSWSLDMPIRAASLDIRPGCRPPTLGQLLSHSAGLGNDLRATRFLPDCEPGQAFVYAGQGYLVLQALLASTTGQPADEFLRARVFDPLGMERSSFRAPGTDDVATGHVDPIVALLVGGADATVVAIASVLAAFLIGLCGLVSFRVWRRKNAARAALAITASLFAALLGFVLVGSELTVRTAPWSDRVLLPSSLRSTAEDLARFAVELLEPRLLRRETRDLLLAPRADVAAGMHWGAGIGIDRTTEPATWWQWGSNPGSQSLFVIVPDRGDAIVVLTNTGGGLDLLTGERSGYALAKTIARHALGIEGSWDIR